MNEFILEERGFDPDKIVENGNKFLLGNGYMGYRGTRDEFSKDKCVGLNLSGFYDGVLGKWRETVNAPNPFYAEIRAGRQVLDVCSLNMTDCHTQLDFSAGIYRTETKFCTADTKLNVAVERFVSWENYRTLCARTEFWADKDTQVTVSFAIDNDIWDINGKHLVSFSEENMGSSLVSRSISQEKNVPVCVCLTFSAPFDRTESREGKLFACFDVFLKGNKRFTLDRFACVAYGEKADSAPTESLQSCKRGYAENMRCQRKAWDKLWKIYDVQLTGDERAQKAIRYSIYQLLILTPREKGSIAARGVSGQTYKGAVFWDTEIFILPFFLNNDPKTAKKLVQYRIDTLNEAEKKAAQYGYGGAFYAWESQDGYDACSDFNVTDVFTHRPVRTYFRDKQIHISGDVCYALAKYFHRTRDRQILIDGGLKTALQCARFFYEYSYYNHIKDRYELLDVIGPDEYHERVNNNAFTNYIAHFAVTTALEFYQEVSSMQSNSARECVGSIDKAFLTKLHKFISKLYLPQPNSAGILEQFDEYFDHEDVQVDKVRKRLVLPNEYWGGSTGVATATRVIKQADVICLFNLIDGFDKQIQTINYDFYLPYTEHGSSLSACMYALTACKTGRPELAWEWFMKTAEIDLTGLSKQWAGEIYIGGTHPAANGGAYLTAVEGFAGLQYDNSGKIRLEPNLPPQIKELSFCVLENGIRKRITVSKDAAEVRDEV